MTLRDLFDWLGEHPWMLLAVLLAPVLGALISPLIHGPRRADTGRWPYVYSTLVYWTCIPGVAAIVIAVYALVFGNENLLDMNLLVFGLPILTMAIALPLIGRATSFSSIPGFDRLLGLMLMLAFAFVLILILSKTRIWLFFGASIVHFAGLLIVLIVGLRWASRKMLR